MQRAKSIIVPHFFALIKRNNVEFHPQMTIKKFREGKDELVKVYYSWVR